MRITNVLNQTTLFGQPFKLSLLQTEELTEREHEIASCLRTYYHQIILSKDQYLAISQLRMERLLERLQGHQCEEEILQILNEINEEIKIT